ncbi:hypothetical protein PybrP1_009563 [[Pythium] brassicae (nom. inval.)]|nr:hypothetical protein PybrP1_009563 [[Pythium] brassicae (nom. inval.)]
MVQSEATSSVAPVIAIRQFHDEDLAALRPIFADGFSTVPEGSEAMVEAYIQSSFESDLGNIHATYNANGGNFWVATADLQDGETPQVVGMVALEKKEDGEGELRRMSVKREFRRFGVGKLLVSELEAWAKAHKYERISLSTGEIVTTAHAFYQALGYKKTGERKIDEESAFIVYDFVKQL